MKIERFVSACLTVALALGLAATAKAGILTVTYQGYGSIGDEIGIFPPDASGQFPYAEVFTLNDSIDSHFYSPNGSGVGGIGTAALTIDGVTVVIGDSADVSFSTAGYEDMLYSDASGTTPQGYVAQTDYQIQYWNNPPASFDMRAPGTYYFGDNFTYPYVQMTYIWDEADVLSTDIGLSPMSVTFAYVPEPVTWAMLILGLGMIGLAARRRNVGVAFAA